MAESNLLQALLLTGDWDETEHRYETDAVKDGLSGEPALV